MPTSSDTIQESFAKLGFNTEMAPPKRTGYK